MGKISPKNKLKVIAAIQVRMGSTRLPGKAIKKINGKTLIEWINYRLSFCKEVDQIVLSTSDTSENDPLESLAKDVGIDYFRGSETDLIKRLLETAKKFSADAVIRVTGDCPLVDPEILDKMIKIYRNKAPEIDYVTNVLPPTFPDGIDIEIISTKTLESLDKEIKDPLYREYLTTTILENPYKFRVFNYASKKNLFHLRLTVDYPEDFELVKIIFTKLHKDGNIFVLEDILNLFKKEPGLIKINEKWVDKEIIGNIRGKAFHNLKQESKSK